MTPSEVVGFDLGGTNFRVGRVNANYELSHPERTSSLALFDDDDPLATMGNFLESYIERTGGEVAAIVGGFPATVDRDRRRVLSTSNIASMQNLDVADVFEERFGLPVFIDRDVNMLLRHDIHSLGLPTKGVVVGVYVGTGLGNGISVDGRVLVGRHGAAGELGHIPVLGNPRVCGCGNTGCIETLSSGLYLTEALEASGLDVDISQVFVQCPDEPFVDSMIWNIAAAIATEVNIFDPEVVILGGGVVQMAGFPGALLEDRVITMARKPWPAGDLRFVYSVPGQHNGVIGAGILAFEMLGQTSPASS